MSSKYKWGQTFYSYILTFTLEMHDEKLIIVNSKEVQFKKDVV